MRPTLQQLSAAFGLIASEGASLGDCARIGSGHIHETWKVAVRDAASPGLSREYVLQRLNGEVFPDLPALVENWRRVCEHLRAEMLRASVEDVDRRCVTPVATAEGSLVARDEDGAVWRCSVFIADSVSYDEAPAEAVVESAAKLFGAFGRSLARLPGAPLPETIAGFHDLDGRMRELRNASEEDLLGRRGACEEEVAECEALHSRIASAFERIGPRPVRTVHNDCKLNNALLDARGGEGLCVVDLDTVMPGRLEYDFGEFVRTAVCGAPEDEPDLGRLCLDVPLFRAATRGTLAGWGGEIRPEELAALPLAGGRMALENGIRFLADHLRGDRYFQVHHAGHNLQRARAQLRLAELFWEGLPWQREIVEEEAAALHRE